MPANWNLFESGIAKYWGNPTTLTHSVNQAATTFASLYTAAILPAQTSYGATVLLPKTNILREGWKAMSQKPANIQGPDRMLPLAQALIQFWASIPYFPEYGTSGTTFNPLPAPPPTVSPVGAGVFIPQKDLDAALAEAPADARKALQKNVFDLDPVVLLPSPIIFFAGNPIELSAQLYAAIGQPNPTAELAAQKLVNVFRTHLTTISGFYVGFTPPGTVPPLAIVPWTGVS